MVHVYWGEGLNPVQKNLRMEDFCEACPRCEMKELYRYATKDEVSSFFADDKVFVRGHYYCPCNLEPDSPDCIYDPEEEVYYDV